VFKGDSIALELIVELHRFAQVKVQLGDVFAPGPHHREGPTEPVAGRVGRTAVDRAEPIGIKRVQLVFDFPDISKRGVEPNQNDDSLPLRHGVVASDSP